MKMYIIKICRTDGNGKRKKSAIWTSCHVCRQVSAVRQGYALSQYRVAHQHILTIVCHDGQKRGADHTVQIAIPPAHVWGKWENTAFIFCLRDENDQRDSTDICILRPVQYYSWPAAIDHVGYIKNSTASVQKYFDLFFSTKSTKSKIIKNRRLTWRKETQDYMDE